MGAAAGIAQTQAEKKNLSLVNWSMLMRKFGRPVAGKGPIKIFGDDTEFVLYNSTSDTFVRLAAPPFGMSTQVEIQKV